MSRDLNWRLDLRLCLRKLDIYDLSEARSDGLIENGVFEEESSGSSPFESERRPEELSGLITPTISLSTSLTDYFLLFY